MLRLFLTCNGVLTALHVTFQLFSYIEHTLKLNSSFVHSSWHVKDRERRFRWCRNTALSCIIDFYPPTVTVRFDSRIAQEFCSSQLFHLMNHNILKPL